MFHLCAGIRQNRDKRTVSKTNLIQNIMIIHSIPADQASRRFGNRLEQGIFVRFRQRIFRYGSGGNIVAAQRVFLRLSEETAVLFQVENSLNIAVGIGLKPGQEIRQLAGFQIHEPERAAVLTGVRVMDKKLHQAPVDPLAAINDLRVTAVGSDRLVCRQHLLSQQKIAQLQRNPLPIYDVFLPEPSVLQLPQPVFFRSKDIVFVPGFFSCPTTNQKQPLL